MTCVSRRTAPAESRGQQLRIQLTPEGVKRAVAAYNERFRFSEMGLYYTAQRARGDLEAKTGGPILLDFTGDVNRWGKTRASYETWSYAADTLPTLPWYEIRGLETSFSVDRAEYVVDLCERLVNGIVERGGKRREYSYASKLLHWLWPEQVPVNDTNVRNEWLGVKGQGRDPYRRVVLWMFKRAKALQSFEKEIVGEVEPRTVLRAIDKTVWWIVDENRR